MKESFEHANQSAHPKHAGDHGDVAKSRQRLIPSLLSSYEDFRSNP